MNKSLLGIILVLTVFLNAQNSKDSFTKAISNQVNRSINPKNKLTISQATLKAINEARSKKQICSKAVTPLRWNKTLYYRAKEHAIDMAVTKKLQHNGSGLDTDKTAKHLGLKRGSYFYERVNQKINDKTLYSGELIIRTSASMLKSPKDLIEYWVKRQKDCKVIMNPKFSDVALAKVISNKDNKAYWTLMLAGVANKR